ncbi:roadblock/LC7 domain-containing protein [Streptosporangium sp. NPDC020145]|uniref:roadblock/LC7 domain-containing protein n=1 Tax=Streptosporangium sp. NPDC020145 TaxID=3154694 RepID=UPI0034270DA8
MEIRDEVRQEMTRLRERTPDVDGSVVCGADGLTIASDLDGGFAEQTGALSSALLALSRRMADMTGRGTFEETLVSAAGGYALLYTAGPKIVLTILARPGSNLGLLRLEGRRTAENLAAITSRTRTPR